MDIFRTFDALNDYRNFETVVPVIKKCGKHFQGCICYTMTEPRMGGEVYHLDYYVKKAQALEAMGADTICIKDMAGLIAPYDAYDLVKALKGSCQVPIHLHSHFTSGMSPMSQPIAILVLIFAIWPGSTKFSKKRSCPNTSICWIIPRCPSSISMSCSTKPQVACSPTSSTSCGRWML